MAWGLCCAAERSFCLLSLFSLSFSSRAVAWCPGAQVMEGTLEKDARHTADMVRVDGIWKWELLK